MATLVEHSEDFTKECDEAVIALVEVNPFCDRQSATTRQ
jgi:hypothetical protein